MSDRGVVDEDTVDVMTAFSEGRPFTWLQLPTFPHQLVPTTDQLVPQLVPTTQLKLCTSRAASAVNSRPTRSIESQSATAVFSVAIV